MSSIETGVIRPVEENAYDGLGHMIDPAGAGDTPLRDISADDFGVQPTGPELSGDPAVDAKTIEAYTARLLRLDRTFKRELRLFQPVGAQTDGSGNLVVQTFVVPGGFEAHLSSFTAVPHPSTTYNPASPFANAAAYMFLATGGQGTGVTGTVPTSLYQGLVAFAPTSSGGPILPGQWTFNDTNAPIFRTGEAVFFVIVGTSAIANLRIQIRQRIQLREL